MVIKGPFRAWISLAMIFLSFYNSCSCASICFKSSFENIYSNRDESSDLFIMFSPKGTVSIISMDNNTPLLELKLSHPLVSTSINIKIIDFEELNILPGDDGKLYLIHSQSDTFKLINTTIPELVKQSPIASKYLPNVLFRGKEKIKRYSIDLDKGSINRLKPSLLPSSPSVLSHHLNNRNSTRSNSSSSQISFDRIDYILQSVINNSFIAWNATYSVINITNAIPYEEYYPVLHVSDYEILKQYGDHYQYIYKYNAATKRFLMMSDQMKGDITYDESLKPLNKDDSHTCSLWVIIISMIVVSFSFVIGYSLKIKANTKEKKIIITTMISHKRKTVDTGSEDSISQLSTGSRIIGNKNNELKQRNSISYTERIYYRTYKERNEKGNCLNKKEDNYEPFHRESAPEFTMQMNDLNDNNNNNNTNTNSKLDNNQYIKNLSSTQQLDILNEESNEEELSPNKVYTMKKITLITTDKPKCVPPFQLEKIIEQPFALERSPTFNRSRQTSSSFKKKFTLFSEEKEQLKRLKTKYLQELKTSSLDIINRIDKCDTNSQKYYQIYKIINNSSNESEDNQAEGDNQLLDEMVQSAHFSQMCDTGRFITNFQDIQLIGKGGFGSVFKAKHKIDDCYYAIKIIKFSVGIDEDISKINEVQEIKTMMKVEHKNIVRYITCWFEFKDLQVLNNKKVRSLSMEDVPAIKTLSKKSKGFHTKNNKSSFNHLSEFELVVKDNDYESIIFESEIKPHDQEFNNENCNTKDKDYIANEVKDSSIIFGSSCNSEEINIIENGDSDDDDQEDICPFDQSSNKNSEVIDIDKRKKKMTLTYPVYFYMQMEYCEGFPLSYYLEQRTTAIPEDLIVHIFRQISIAVQHIHNKKIIHRDLKPANIFFHGQFKVKIGDFGLAAEIDQSHKEKVGTFLYQSPEQIEGKAYNEKVDIYALGLILLEMCLFFNTKSERRMTLMNVRKMIYPDTGEIPSLLPFTTEMSLAKKMTHKNPCIRPSITEVINSKEMKEMIETI